MFWCFSLRALLEAMECNSWSYNLETNLTISSFNKTRTLESYKICTYKENLWKENITSPMETSCKRDIKRVFVAIIIIPLSWWLCSTAGYLIESYKYFIEKPHRTKSDFPFLILFLLSCLFFISKEEILRLSTLLVVL